MKYEEMVDYKFDRLSVEECLAVIAGMIDRTERRKPMKEKQMEEIYCALKALTRKVQIDHDILNGLVEAVKSNNLKASLLLNPKERRKA
jgi:hypothetical protein